MEMYEEKADTVFVDNSPTIFIILLWKSSSSFVKEYYKLVIRLFIA